MRKEHLAAAEDKAVFCVRNFYTGSLIVSAVIEGTAYCGTVGVVGSTAIGVINQKCELISIKTAIGEHIISAIIDTAIVAPVCTHVGKMVKFAEIINIDSCVASDYAAIGNLQGGKIGITRVTACDSSTGEVPDDAVINCTHLGPVFLVFVSFALKKNSVSVSNCFVW